MASDPAKVTVNGPPVDPLDGHPSGANRAEANEGGLDRAGSSPDPAAILPVVALVERQVEVAACNAGTLRDHLDGGSKRRYWLGVVPARWWWR